MKTWTPSADVDAQVAHIAVACAAVWLGPACFSLSPWWGVLGIQAFALVKEFVYDVGKGYFFGVIPEEGDSWKGSLLDWSFYQVGCWFALGLWYATLSFRP